ncbi:threonine/serine exporter family protein [Mycolicibacterium sp. CBMA 226]|uniref:threonine/serine exporter family protein n=1 Tax=Mycolicibacterium sp. CBMA 226 TaxID=2606611 RepID=UPI0012DE4464|nr:threonine/serine exporter family protein [Mycolicibacterium sp. CBMA 226]MUL74961.1 threonine/serine exporter family protein [Mycolicibacterium sp. CBMA 226]
MTESDPATDRLERYDVVLTSAALLFENGQSTEMVSTAVQRLNRGLGVDARIDATWSALFLTASDSRDVVRVVPVKPVAVNMCRVASLMTVVDRGQDGPLTVSEVNAAIQTASGLRVSATVVFAAACATGACALSVIFGVSSALAILLIACSAAAGGLARRWLGARGVGPLVQAFVAAALAGAVGGVAAHLGMGAVAGLVVLCPAMVLVPGPHILNGTLDLLNLRMTLGAARLGFSALLLTAIAGGLLLGLAAFGQTIAVTAPSDSANWYLDLAAAGVAAASYAVYWSVPWRMAVWPVLVGMAAHVLHWWVVNSGGSVAAAAFVSCLLVGAILSPAATRLRIPFAAIGFASVVALVPGVFAFRALSGFVHFTSAPSVPLLVATAADFNIVVLTVAAMALGLCGPKYLYLMGISMHRRNAHST